MARTKTQSSRITKHTSHPKRQNTLVIPNEVRDLGFFRGAYTDGAGQNLTPSLRL
jgi:hypothetical protein